MAVNGLANAYVSAEIILLFPERSVDSNRSACFDRDLFLEEPVTRLFEINRILSRSETRDRCGSQSSRLGLACARRIAWNEQHLCARWD